MCVYSTIYICIYTYIHMYIYIYRHTLTKARELQLNKIRENHSITLFLAIYKTYICLIYYRVYTLYSAYEKPHTAQCSRVIPKCIHSPLYKSSAYIHRFSESQRHTYSLTYSPTSNGRAHMHTFRHVHWAGHLPNACNGQCSLFNACKGHALDWV